MDGDVEVTIDSSKVSIGKTLEIAWWSKHVKLGWNSKKCGLTKYRRRSLE